MDKETRKYALQMATASSMGIALVLTIFGSFFLGLFIDEKLGTGRFFSFLFLALGVIVGFKNFYLLIKKAFSDENRKDDTGDNGHGTGTSAKKD